MDSRPLICVSDVYVSLDPSLDDINNLPQNNSNGNGNGNGNSQHSTYTSGGPSIGINPGISHEPKRHKKDSSDSRWQKRFVWPDSLHRLFVSSVFDVGLKSSTPSAILQVMGEANDYNGQVTTERIKSHLQKFRLHRQKSEKEFLESYGYWRRRLEEGGEGGEEGKLDSSMDSSGENAARACFGVKNFKDDAPSNLFSATPILNDLTEAEKNSEIGRSIVQLSAVLSSLHGVVQSQRLTKPNQSQPIVPPARPNRQSRNTASSYANPHPHPTYQQQYQQHQQHQQHQHPQHPQQPQPQFHPPPQPIVPPFPTPAAAKTIHQDMSAHLEIQNQMRNFKSSEIRKFSARPPPSPRSLPLSPPHSPSKKRKSSVDDVFFGSSNAWDMAGADEDQLFDFLAEGGIGDIS
ncbi:hypothetical protein TrVE_jg4371 [Triparma verrucosa]|uniref:Uncharacterized protein n=1 Tax=Triparma verrucosa TaxID=1606542 RepID=A0A9W7KXV7_9STRA|nr:hypothetical protein TrVE_jg4371 [Triparma verrucosa]